MGQCLLSSVTKGSESKEFRHDKTDETRLYSWSYGWFFIRALLSAIRLLCYFASFFVDTLCFFFQAKVLLHILSAKEINPWMTSFASYTHRFNPYLRVPLVKCPCESTKSTKRLEKKSLSNFYQNFNSYNLAGF